jgi:DNA primase
VVARKQENHAAGDFRLEDPVVLHALPGVVETKCRWPLPDDRTQQVKQANDIVDVVSGYLALRPAGGTYKGLCPFHDDHRPSFDVDPRRQRYRCWSCGKYGDVISFVQEFEHVSFLEARELLARRAGIVLEESAGNAQAQGKALMLDAMRWAAQQFEECYLDSPLAEVAREYVAERGLTPETSLRWGIGYAPPSGHWLVDLATEQKVPLDVLEKVGLIAQRTQGPGYYDRFRDRVQFPIRDVRGRVVAFGGRILPASPLASRQPKYYNSCDTPLFSKSEQLYGLDQARSPAEKAGYLAVVEGYTDVLMAHQLGVPQVVATMGTALNARHVAQIRRFVPRVVLVFDADDGGDTGVDRALEIFASHDMELAIATLPSGLDPCDLLVQEGAGPFRRVLEAATDALEFKLNQSVAREDTATVEGRRRVVDAVLGVIALASPLPGESGAVKTQLMINRIARRLALKEETVWARLDELRKQRRISASTHGPDRYVRSARGGEERGPTGAGHGGQSPRTATAPAALEERQLLEVLLADPALVAKAAAVVGADEIEHPGLRRLLSGLYQLQAAGEAPTLDNLRPHLENMRLAEKAFELQEVGQDNPRREACLSELLEFFRQRREKTVKQELQSQLHAANDHEAALDLLRRLQERSGLGRPSHGRQPFERGPDTSSHGERGGAAPLTPTA